jgi:uncharacterized lipoprotein
MKTNFRRTKHYLSRLFFTFSSALSIGVLIVGCLPKAPLPINYSPSSIMSATGSLSVSEFRYLPAENPIKDKPIASNQIRNTAGAGLGGGEIIIDRDVKVYVRDAVFLEFRFVGIKTNDIRRILKGDIEEFLIDDLGYTVSWKLRLRYYLIDSENNKIIYQSVKSTQRSTAKLAGSGQVANPYGALNETVKLNFEELIKDPEFLKCIN